MPNILITSRFRGNLVGLIGMTAAEAVKGLYPPVRIVEGGGFEKLVWEDTVENSEDGKRFKIRPTARLFRGKIISVGIHSEEYFFVIEQAEDGSHYFNAIPKEPDHDQDDVNWVARGETGYYNEGVA